MVRRPETEPTDRDERLGEAIEEYLALAEGGDAPHPEIFASRYPDLGEDLRAALEGLALVQGLVGQPGESGQRLETGRRIAGYRVVRELGRGGMGVVYEAVHVGLDRPVALKVLGGHAAPDSSGRRRFLNEAKTAAGLHHTHIVPVFDVGQVGGLCYYAMQRIEGSGLDRVLRHLRRDRTTAAGSTHGSASPGRAPSPPPGADESASVAPDDTATWMGPGRSGRGLDLSRGRHDDDEPTPFVPPRGSAYYRWVAEVGRQSAEALAHAHQRGVIHRDVKPSNLLVDARGMIWMADFGLARRLADPSLTQQDSLLGTPRYMSPEQARIGPIDGRSDVYSLGATLYELLTLRPPFEGKTAAELVEQIGQRDPAPPRQADPRIPRDLETIILKTLAKRPADRYATASELAEDLERFLNHEPVRARRIGPVGRLWRFARRRPALAGVSTAAAVAVLTTATVAYIRVVEERDKTRVALRDSEAAYQASRAARRAELSREAELVRKSMMPNRRKTGLELIRNAVDLGPDAALEARLRGEAVEFLVLRDVEARPAIPTGRAQRLAFGPDGTRLATLSGNGDDEVFTLWNVEARQPLDSHRLRPARANASQSTSSNAASSAAPNAPAPPGASSSKDARRPPSGFFSRSVVAMAAAGQCIAVGLPNGRGVRLFDATTGAPVRDLEIPGRRLWALWATPDGHRLVTYEAPAPPEGRHRGGPEGPRPPGTPRDEYQVNLYDPEQIDRPIATLERWEAAQGPPGPGQSSGRGPDSPLVAVAPDGKAVAVARRGMRVVSLWSTEDGQPLGTIEAQTTQSDLSALALSPDDVLATAGGGSIGLWDLQTLTPLPGLDTRQAFIRYLRFNPSGTLLAASGGGAGIEVWDTATHAEVAVLPTPERVSDLAFAPDGRTLVAASGDATSVWAVVDPIARAQLGGFDVSTTALAFRGDGLLAMGSYQGEIRFWEPGRSSIAVGEPRDEVIPGDRDPSAGPRPVALAFDGDRLIAVDSDSLRYCDKAPRCTKATRVEIPATRGWPPGMRPPSTPQIARAAGGRALILARSDRLLAWDPHEPDRLEPLKLPEPLRWRGPDPDRSRGGPSGRRDGPPEPPRSRGTDSDRPRGGPGPFGWRALAAGPAGDRLYLLDFGGGVHALSLDRDGTARLSWSRPGHATALAAAPDGRTLAIRDRQEIILLDAIKGTERHRLPPSDSSEGWGRSLGLAVSPDGRELAAGTPQGQVEIWSLADPRAPVLRLPGHRGSVRVLAYDAHGRRLASGGDDHIVEVWDLGRLRTELGRLGLAWGADARKE
jgi:eukaryotic-like serine/threonine-protein kinase